VQWGLAHRTLGPIQAIGVDEVQFRMDLSQFSRRPVGACSNTKRTSPAISVSDCVIC
jgi:hypothetical protein